MPTPDFVRNDLWVRAQERAAISGFTFTDDCWVKSYKGA